MDSIDLGRSLGKLEEFADWARPNITQVMADVQEIKARRTVLDSILESRLKLVGAITGLIGAASAVTGLVLHFHPF